MSPRVLLTYLAIATEACLAGLVTAIIVGGLLWRLGDPTGTIWATQTAFAFAAATIALTAATCICGRLQDDR